MTFSDSLTAGIGATLYLPTSSAEDSFMNHLILTTTAQRQLQPLVEDASTDEMSMLEAAVKRTEERLKPYEAAHGMSSTQFLQRYENDELAETLDFAEWIGEFRLLTRLREEAAACREIKLVH